MKNIFTLFVVLFSSLAFAQTSITTNKMKIGQTTQLGKVYATTTIDGKVFKVDFKRKHLADLIYVIEEVKPGIYVSTNGDHVITIENGVIEITNVVYMTLGLRDRSFTVRLYTK